MKYLLEMLRQWLAKEPDVPPDERSKGWLNGELGNPKDPQDNWFDIDFFDDTKL